MPTDFCSMLRISTGATLTESNGKWAVSINHSGTQKDLATNLTASACQSSTSAGVKLAHIVLLALNRAVSSGNQEALKAKAGRQLPMILLKEFLFQIVGPCTSCRGRGCNACHKMGVV